MAKNECEHVKCDGCGHLFASGGQKVTVLLNYFPGDTLIENYCSQCVKPYDIREETSFIYPTYKKMMKVDATGCPIGYKKIV